MIITEKQLKELAVTQEDIKNCIDKLEAEFPYSKAIDILSTIRQESVFIKMFKTKPLDRLCWLIRCAYIKGFNEALDVFGTAQNDTIDDILQGRC